jgi:hypothetical protein
MLHRRRVGRQVAVVLALIISGYGPSTAAYFESASEAISAQFPPPLPQPEPIPPQGGSSTFASAEATVEALSVEINTTAEALSENNDPFRDGSATAWGFVKVQLVPDEGERIGDCVEIQYQWEYALQTMASGESYSARAETGSTSSASLSGVPPEFVEGCIEGEPTMTCTATSAAVPAARLQTPTSNHIVLNRGREYCTIDTLGPAVASGNFSSGESPAGSWIGRVGDVYEISVGAQAYTAGGGIGNAAALANTTLRLFAPGESFSCDAAPPCSLMLRYPEPVPTMSNWGISVMALLLLGPASWFSRKRNSVARKPA